MPTLEPNGEYLTRVWRESVYPMAARMGMSLKLPPVQPRSRLAHEAAHWARSIARFDEMNAAIFRAFFERGEDIGDPNVLVRLAAALGLDSQTLQPVLASHQYEASVLEDESAAHAIGISGVPAFVADRKVAKTGVQPLEKLRGLIQRARSA